MSSDRGSQNPATSATAGAPYGKQEQQQQQQQQQREQYRGVTAGSLSTSSPPAVSSSSSSRSSSAPNSPPRPRTQRSQSYGGPSASGGALSASKDAPLDLRMFIDKKSKKYKPGKGFASVFADPEQRASLFEHLPVFPVVRVKKNPKVLDEIHGPVDLEDPHGLFSEFVWGRAVSTYPFLPTKDARDGDPVVDGYLVQLLDEDAAVAVVTDGCNWGSGPLEASNVAKRAFADYLMLHLSEIQEIRDAGHFLLDAVSYCHHKICEAHPGDIWSAGTTTLCGGVLLKLKPPKDMSVSSPQWAFVSTSVGDCKAFHYSLATGTLTDLTSGNRKLCRDATDCGGRLGPYVREGEPDLRNIQVSYSVCQEGDLILIVTDGVHDNLDPQMLGCDVHDFGEEYRQLSSWDDLKDVDQRENLKETFMNKRLVALIENNDESERDVRKKVFSYEHDPDRQLLPMAVVNRIIRHCLNITGAGREWMEQNPVGKLPPDYVAFPGKMDHATCVVLRCGSYARTVPLEKLSLRSSGS